MRQQRARLIPAALLLLLIAATAMPCPAQNQQQPTGAQLVQQFKAEQFFWRQFEVAQKIVRLHDRTVLPELEPFLKDENRHVRGNAAFIFAALGDDRGFEVIRGILNDRSPRPPGEGIPGSTGHGWSLPAQIRADRYYAAHLFGDLKDPRAVPILIPLLHDDDVNYIVPWSLAEIGDKSAVPPLTQTLRDPNPDMRVLAIYALEKLHAKEALPNLRALVSDQEKIHFDNLISVGEAARQAIAKLEAKP